MSETSASSAADSAGPPGEAAADAAASQAPLRYRAFLSYSHRNSEIAARLQSRLEQYALPHALRLIRPGVRFVPRPLKPVFRDESDNRADPDLRRVIRDGLGASEFLVVLCSPAAARSKWVLHEIADFMKLPQGDNIIAVVADGEPNAKDRTQECLPRPLRFQHHIETRENGRKVVVFERRHARDGLWIDWRPAAARDRRLAFLRVVVALLGLASLDELVRRDAQASRRRSRNRILIAAGVVGAMLFALAGVVHLQNEGDSAQLARLATDAERAGDFDEAARYAKAALVGADWPLVGFDSSTAAAELSTAEMRSMAEVEVNGPQNDVHTDARADLSRKPPLVDAAFSPDDSLFATASHDGDAQLWRSRTGEAVGGPMRSGDGTPLTDLAFAPDRRLLATATTSGLVQVWDIQTQPRAARTITEPGQVWRLAFSPDSQRLAIASDQNGELWDVGANRRLATFAHTGPVEALAYAPDGTMIATGAESVKLWDGRTGAAIGGPLPHKGVDALAFSTDSRLLASGGYDQTIRLWDVRRRAEAGPPIKADAAINALAFAPDGRTLAAGTSEGSVLLFDLQGGHAKPIGLPMRQCARDGIPSVAFSPDGARLLSACHDGEARLWDARTGAPLGAPMRHKQLIETAEFSHAGERVLTASDDGTARVWSAEPLSPVTPPLLHGEMIQTVVFSPDGALLATTSDDRTVGVWNVRTGARVLPPLRAKAGVITAAFSPDGRRLLTSGWDYQARLWDLRTGHQIGSAFGGHHRVWDAVFSPPPADLVATASRDGVVQLWSGLTGKRVGPPMRQGSQINSVAFSPDGSRLVTASDEGWTRVWDVRSGRLAQWSCRSQTPSAAPARPICEPADRAPTSPLCKRLNGAADMAIFSPDGARIAIASADGAARIVDAWSGGLVATMCHAGEVDWLDYSRDGKRLVTGSWDQTARLWDATTGKPLGAVMQTGGRVQVVTFSPDGSRVATASWDGAGRVWDGFTGAPVGAPMQHGNHVNTIAFSPKGDLVATGSSDWTARIWRLQPETQTSDRASAARACAVTLANGLSAFTAGELAAAPALTRKFNGDACRPRGPPEQIARSLGLGGLIDLFSEKPSKPSA